MEWIAVWIGVTIFSLFISSVSISLTLALHRTSMHFYIVNDSVIVVCVFIWICTAIHCVPASIDMWLLWLICQEEIKSYRIHNHANKRSCDNVKQKKPNGNLSKTIATRISVKKSWALSEGIISQITAKRVSLTIKAQCITISCIVFFPVQYMW